jgi:hypothetical protein
MQSVVSGRARGRVLWDRARAAGIQGPAPRMTATCTYADVTLSTDVMRMLWMMTTGLGGQVMMMP